MQNLGGGVDGGANRVHYGQLNDREGVTWYQLKLLAKSTKLFHSEPLEIFRPLLSESLSDWKSNGVNKAGHASSH